VVCRRNGCRVSPVLDVPGGVLRLDAVQTAPALCVLARNADATETPRHHFRDKPLEAGSYTIEGIVAIGVFFLLLTVIVQLGFLVLARNVAATSVDAALRKAVSADLSEAAVEEGLARDVRAIVPGANDVIVDVAIDSTAVVALVRFRWIPPGPDLVPVTMSIERSIVRVVPP